jgi:chemotaxis protein CheZ
MKIDDAGDSEDLQALFDNIAATAGKVAPPPPPEPDPSGDNTDLQALFDSVAASAIKPAPAPSPVPAAAADASGDNDDLQALFDSVVAQTPSPKPSAPSVTAGAVTGAVTDDVAFNRLGHLARQLHDSLRELGYDRLLSEAAEALPDTRQRLAYIAQMTEQAASRVLNAVDIAQPVQDQLSNQSKALSARWDKMFANQLSVDEFKQLASDTRSYFNTAPNKLQVTSTQLTEIMMAQDFQDLTGQVIKKVVELANNVEQQMLSILIEVMPNDKKTSKEGLMNGPVISASGRSDVVENQNQVDDLLESLGF